MHDKLLQDTRMGSTWIITLCPDDTLPFPNRRRPIRNLPARGTPSSLHLLRFLWYA